MKFIGRVVGFAVKLALLVSAIIVAMEVVDRLAEKNRFRYMVSEEFSE